MNNKIAQLKQNLIHGVAPALATPLEADGRTVNTAVTSQLVHFLADRGTTGVLIGGTTGEGIMLTMSERIRLTETAITACREVERPFQAIVQVGTNNVPDTLTLTQHALDHNADALLVLCPYFLGMNDDDLFTYFSIVSAAAGNTPMMVYDIPHLAINGISPALLKRLSVLPNFAGVKCSRKDGQMIRKLIDALPEGTMLLAGNEPIAIGSLAAGAHGMISGLSTAVPEPFVAITRAIGAGDLAAAQTAQNQIIGILTMFDGSRRIGGIKQILNERGVPVGNPMPPRQPITDPIWPQMSAYLNL